MEFDELKKGFWGYRREDVIRYVEEQEAEMAKQLERRDASWRKRNPIWSSWRPSMRTGSAIWRRSW